MDPLGRLLEIDALPLLRINILQHRLDSLISLTVVEEYWDKG